MASESTSPALRRVSLAMTYAAVAAAEAASAPPDRNLAVALIYAGVLGGSAAAASRWLRPRAGRTQLPPAWCIGVLLGILVLPLLLEPVYRRFGGEGRALEQILVACLRNLALGLVALSGWPAYQRLAVLAATFLALFASGIAETPAAPVLAAVAAAIGSLWLLLAHWQSRRTAFASAGVSARLPGLPAAVVFVVVGGSFAAGLAGPQGTASALGELLPTSGGTGDYDPHARGGLNDGDEETRGTDRARSVGFTESETLLEDDRPSLYDAVSEQYGEARKPKEREKTVAIDARAVVEPRERPAENLRASREFSTCRRGPASLSRPADRTADALFYVAGSTPLHLRMAAYDRFDGITWKEENATPAIRVPGEGPESGWFSLRQSKADIFTGVERHRIKVGRLKSDRFPTPAHLTAFRLGKVDRPDFFAWLHESVLGLRHRQIPAGVTLETESQTADPTRLRMQSWTGTALSAASAGAGNTRPDPEVADLLRQWTRGTPFGWHQVEAVCTGLRRHAVHDRRALTPEDCRDAVADFLLKSRRGPDYLFATSAAVLLRSLGYETRLVSGFYAAPDRYDPVSAHTPVGAADVHFWAEVRLPGNAWTPVEATPGYELAAPHPSLIDRLRSAVAITCDWLVARAPTAAITMAGLIVLFWRRRQLIDRTYVVAWCCFPGQSWRQVVLAALRLLERRARWAGRPRGVDETPCRWCGSFHLPSPEDAGALVRLAMLADWAAHAPQDVSPPCAVEEVRRVCRAAIREWTLARFVRASGARRAGRHKPVLVEGIG